MWIIKARDRASEQSVGIMDSCDNATFKRFYVKIKHLKKSLFFTDDWASLTNVLPRERYITIDKPHTAAKSNISNVRPPSTRRTQIVSKNEDMVDNALKALVCPDPAG